MTSTTREEFLAALDSGHRVLPVIRKLFADQETPVGVYRKLADGAPGTFLLESASQGGIFSRWSFVGAGSLGVLTGGRDELGEVAHWHDYGLDQMRAFGDLERRTPLDALAHLHMRWRTPKGAGHPPLTGGLVGFIGWEAVRQLEHLPNMPAQEVRVPTQALSFVSELVALDHRTGTVHLIATVLGEGQDSPDSLWQDAQNRLDRLQVELAVPTEAEIANLDLSLLPTARARQSPEVFQRSVVSAKDFIRAGEVFQVVLSQRFEHELIATPVEVYRVLRVLNPSPYMFLLSFLDDVGVPFSVVGSSPEALVKVQGDRALTHPIAGSRPRGDTPERDVELAEELLADEKERAEHLMLVDLARNDLAKVCVAGSVEVSEFMQVERFSHIMHLVSSVEGTVRGGLSSVDVFRATFPAGTLSGAPKPRALEIIDLLEQTQRGVYGGVAGYFDFAGDADLAIAIRTAVLKGDTAFVQAGAGLVADSEPESEHLESVNKAEAPLRAVRVANQLHQIGQSRQH